MALRQFGDAPRPSILVKLPSGHVVNMASITVIDRAMLDNPEDQTRPFYVATVHFIGGTSTKLEGEDARRFISHIDGIADPC